MLSSQKISVLVAHANPLVSAGLEAALRDREEFQLIQPSLPGGPSDSALISDVAVTDCETAMNLAGRGHNNRRLLILTDDMSEVTIRRAVDLGIRGYLQLSSRIESVLQAIRDIHRGGTVIAPIVMAKMAESLRSQSLSERETQVLGLIMQGLSDKAIAHRLKRSIGTAKTHVKNILAKLEVSSRTEAIAVALRRGLLPEDPVSLPQRRRLGYRDRGRTSLSA